MRKPVRYIISTATLLAVLLLCVFVRAKARENRQLLTCDGIKVEYADDYRFVTEDDIKAYLDESYGPYIGQRLDSIRLDRIERTLDERSAISSSQAYTTDDRLLHIRITQMEPVVRFQMGERGFYADARGHMFPLQSNYTSHVPVIDGNIPIDCPDGYKGAPRTDKEKAWMDGVMSMLSYMGKSKVWQENIVQIHVDGDGNIVMVPREGKERFIFGSPFDAEAKFGRMERYYRSIVPAKGEGYYSTVNVQFDNQIVCKK